MRVKALLTIIHFNVKVQVIEMSRAGAAWKVENVTTGKAQDVFSQFVLERKNPRILLIRHDPDGIMIHAEHCNHVSLGGENDAQKDR